MSCRVVSAERWTSLRPKVSFRRRRTRLWRGLERVAYYVYVLQSLKNGKRYTGSTSKAPLARLKEHNSGANRWTRQNRPFKVVYQEEYQSAGEARRRERFLKGGAGRRIREE